MAALKRFRVVFENGTHIVVEAETWGANPVDNLTFKGSFDISQRAIGEFSSVVAIVEEEYIVSTIAKN